MSGNGQKVFIEEWLESLRIRYEQIERHSRPLLYFYATEPDFDWFRRATESYLALVSGNSQHRVIQSLRSPKNFQNTYNELVVGQILAAKGFNLEYEKAFGDLTPDWFAENGGERLVAEVLTINTSDLETSQERQSGDLSGRLQKIKVDAAIKLSVEDYSRPKLSPDKNKRIAHAIAQWLRSKNRQLEDEFQIEELTFKLIQQDRGFSHLQIIGPGRSFWVNNDPLRLKIQEKFSKYRNVLCREKMGFIVFVFAAFQTCLGFNELEDVMVGKELFAVQYNEASGEVTNQYCHRKTDGLFSSETILSGAYFVKPSHTSNFSQGLVNSTAAQPVLTRFDGVCNL